MQETIKPRTIFCHDNLPILRGMNSESVDLIYLDPPFNKGKRFHAPIGTTAEGATFNDIWSPSVVKDKLHNELNDTRPDIYKYLEAVENIGSKSAKYYLIFMAVRLMEMKRILKPIGSIFLHCDPTASHYLKILMDTIFGNGNLINEIIWCYTGPGSPKMRQFNRKHDTIFWYSAAEKWIFNKDEARTPHKDGGPHAGGFVGASKKPNDPEYGATGKVLETWWTDIAIAARSKNEYLGYPTQKPKKLLDRIIKVSSNEGDLVLDPFCGCATTCIAAEKLNRQWIGIDSAEKAYDLVKSRLNKEVLGDLDYRSRGKPILRTDVPARTDRDHKKAPTKEDKNLLYGAQDGTCGGCGTKFDIHHLEIDHKIPVSQGGWHNIENLQLLCSHCKRIKGDRPMEYLAARRRVLFDNGTKVN